MHYKKTRWPLITVYAWSWKDTFILRDIAQQRCMSFGTMRINSSAIRFGHFPLSYSNSPTHEHKTAGSKLALKEQINTIALWFALVAGVIYVWTRLQWTGGKEPTWFTKRSYLKLYEAFTPYPYSALTCQERTRYIAINHPHHLYYGNRWKHSPVLGQAVYIFLWCTWLQLTGTYWRYGESKLNHCSSSSRGLIYRSKTPRGLLRNHLSYTRSIQSSPNICITEIKRTMLFLQNNLTIAFFADFSAPALHLFFTLHASFQQNQGCKLLRST